LVAAIRSPRFEEAVSKAAALVAHFCNTEADVRLATSTETGEFGTGSRHRRDDVYNPQPHRSTPPR
jgi:hypothetical protein